MTFHNIAPRALDSRERITASCGCVDLIITVCQPLYILASNSFLLLQVYIILLMVKESYNFRN